MAVSLTVGFLCAGISVLFFGSNFVPVKRVETGDGVFYAWVMCSGIWTVGLLVNMYLGFPSFEPWAMLGGAIWTTGNMMSVPTIKFIGLGLGMLLWGTSNMLIGWATGRFGLFGVDPQLPCDDPESVAATCIHDVGLNYAGMCLACLSLVVYILVQPEDMSSGGKGSQATDKQTEADLLIDHVRNDDYMSFMPTPRIIGNKPFREINQVPSFHDDLDKLEGLPNVESVNVKQAAASVIDKLSRGTKRTIGVTLALVSGLFYGTNLTPPQVVHDHGGDPYLMDYIFSHFCGIYFTMTVYFMAYCAIKGNEALIYPKAIVPAFFSGVMWAIAQVSWFIANSSGMGFAVSFPIIACGPGLVASLWGIFVFKEIKGRRNMIVISIAALLTVTSGLVIGMSK